MKKFLLFALSALCFVACSSDSEDPIVPQPQDEEKVNVILTYTLTGEGGGSMSRAVNEFTPFYEKIKSGELMSEGYNITFTNKETGFVFSTKGNWKENTMITLPKGKYTVTGNSIVANSNSSSFSDKCIIKINAEIEITNSGELVIPVEYNCFLIAIKKDDLASAEFKYSPNGSQFVTEMSLFEQYYYVFINAYELMGNTYLILTGNNSSRSLLYLKNETFQNGKYYIFENIPGSYSIPEMESGM